MCYRNGCTKTNISKVNVCAEHLAEIAGIIKSACPGLTDVESRDYSIIWAIINDRNTLDVAMTHLSGKYTDFEALVKNNVPIKIDEMPILHFLLKGYEENFGFGRDCLMTGILSAQAFFEQLTEAYSTCDFGADADHGAFTHRLQWFAIMYVATDGAPEATTQSILTTPIVNLYKKLGDPVTCKRVCLPTASGYLEPGSSLWAALFDLGGSGGFNHPDNFHSKIRKQEIGSAALSNAILEIQREVVMRRVRVINCLQFLGAVKLSNRATKADMSDKLSEREDLINKAIVGGNIVQFMRYRDLNTDQAFSGEFMGGSSIPAGSFYAGEGTFEQRVSNKAVQNFAASLVNGTRWKAKYPNFLVRKQQINSLGLSVHV